MTDQLTHEQRKALYDSRKGKKQVLPSTLVFQSTSTQTLKNKDDEAKVVKMRNTATAVRGEKNKYTAVQHPPKFVAVSPQKPSASSDATTVQSDRDGVSKDMT